MMQSAFAYPWSLAALSALVVLAVLAWRTARWRQRSLACLGSSANLARRPRGQWRWLRTLCLIVGLALLSIGAAGPQWGQDWEQVAAPGRDLVVVLDCSRSMLAETPSRLEQARTALL